MARPDDVAMAARDVLRASVGEAPRGIQTRLAEDLGVSKQTVSSWLSGDLPIHPRWFIRLEDALSLEQFVFAEVTGLAEALGFDRLTDYDKRIERWEFVFGSTDPDALPPKREARYRPSPKVAHLEQRLTAIEGRLAAAEGGATETQTGTVDKEPATGSFDPDE